MGEHPQPKVMVKPQTGPSFPDAKIISTTIEKWHSTKTDKIRKMIIAPKDKKMLITVRENTLTQGKNLLAEILV